MHKEGVRRLYNIVSYIHIQKCSVFPFYPAKYTNLLSPKKKKKNYPRKTGTALDNPCKYDAKANGRCFQTGPIKLPLSGTYQVLQTGQFRMPKKGNKEENCLCQLMDRMETKPPAVMLKRCQESSTHGAACFNRKVVFYDKCMVHVCHATTSRKLTWTILQRPRKGLYITYI